MAERYDIDNTVLVFQNDTEFQQVVVTTGGITITDAMYRELAELLLDNQTYISTYTVTELNAQNPPYLREEISAIFSLPYIERVVYIQVMYSFKYATIKTFFRSNYSRFMPDYDLMTIQSSEKLKIFQEAFMREYDRFASIIDLIYNVQDVDLVPDSYLNYLAQ